MRDRFEERKIRIPKDDEIVNDMCSLELVKGIPKLPAVRKRTASILGTRHGDAAMALGFAVSSHEENRGQGEAMAGKVDNSGAVGAFNTYYGSGEANYY